MTQDKNIEIDKTKNYIRNSLGIIGPLKPMEVINYIEEGKVEDNDEIFLPSKNIWEKFCNIPDLYILKPELVPEFRYPELVETENGSNDKKVTIQFNKQQKKKKVVRYERLHISLPVRYKKKSLKSTEEELKKSSTIDLSLSGLSFDTYGLLFTKDTNLEIEIELIGFPERFYSLAKIIRISKSFENRYIVSVKFLDMQQKYQKMLVRFLREEIVRRVFLIKGNK